MEDRIDSIECYVKYALAVAETIGRLCELGKLQGSDHEWLLGDIEVALGKIKKQCDEMRKLHDDLLN